MSDLQRELAEVLNRHSVENDSNTPDFILAKFLRGCLGAYAEAVSERDEWHEPSPTRDDITLEVLAMDRHYERLASLHLQGAITEAQHAAATSALRDFQDAATGFINDEITQDEYMAVAKMTTETFKTISDEVNRG